MLARMPDRRIHESNCMYIRTFRNIMGGAEAGTYREHSSQLVRPPSIHTLTASSPHHLLQGALTANLASSAMNSFSHQQVGIQYARPPATHQWAPHQISFVSVACEATAPSASIGLPFSMHHSTSRSYTGFETNAVHAARRNSCTNAGWQ